MAMPKQKPGNSRQNYGTPENFLNAVKKFLRIKRFQLDIAADAQNTVAKRYFTEEDNAFAQPTWKVKGWSWLNPPFSQIAPWVERCAYEKTAYGASIAVLVPASVGANWWKEHVHGKAFALFLNGRITFVGEADPYIKDCTLLLYSPLIQPGYDVWSWNVSSS